ncbi:MAG: Gfo/Idh/MocA family oxidoreductase [Gammaproteobacteria bacterium]|nr:Gfo/Idh/MocA family oxidoreductase [Gammaproteobacteria bacterium]
MSSKTRLVIVGLGLVGKRHADAIARVADAEIVGVIDTDEAARQFAADNNLYFGENLADVFSGLKPDGIILSTPTPLHVEQGRLCIEHGCPVLIEKPLANSAREAAHLVTQAEKASIPILVGHHRRYNPLIRKAKELLVDGAIGELRTVHGQCWFYKPDDYFDQAPWRKLIGAGPVSVNLVHDVDLIRYLCGEIVSVSAQFAPSSRGFENEEVAAAVLRFENQAIGTISVSDGVVSPWSWELTAREYPVYPSTQQSCYQLGGTLGSLSIPDLTVWNQNGQQDWWAPINATSVHREASDPLINQIAHFVEVIRGDAEPLVSGAEGLKTLRVLEAMTESAASSTTVTV